MKKYILIIIVFVLCGTSCRSKIESVQENVKYDDIRSRNESIEETSRINLICTIKDIVNINSIYIIYVQEDNKETIYKIISDKDSVSNCAPIKIGNRERLRLQSCLFSNNFGGYKIRAFAFDALSYGGVDIAIEKSYPYYPDLFFALNLKGLCITD